MPGPGTRPSYPPQLPPEFALAWSVSRSKALRDCERSVFWSYFGCRGAGLPPGHPDAARAWALKHLTALPLVLGVAIHNAAREVLGALHAGRGVPSYEALLESARGTLNAVWRSSQPDLIDRFWRWPGVHAALREVVYRGALRESEIDKARWTLTSCLRHLVTAPVLDDLRRCTPSERWLPDPGPVSFRVSRPPESDTDESPCSEDTGPRRPVRPLLVWAAPDFCYVHTEVGSGSERGLRTGERAWCVGDWKTGAAREEDERLQLATYALWLEATGRPARDGVYLGRIVGLRDARERWYHIGADEREAARAVMAADTRRLMALMADPERADPRPRDDWALARDRRACATCNYLALCRDDLAPVRRRSPDGELGAEPDARADELPPREPGPPRP